MPGDPSTLFLRATFGVLISRDGGRSWRFVCERALGYEGQWDPPIAATRDGRLWVGLEDGLVSTRDGCDVEAAPELDGHTVKDLTTDATGEVVWAITGAPSKKSWVWRRTAADGGHARFERLAALDDTNVMTIEVAGPSRVYVSGQPYSTIRGQIYRSIDGGRTFTTEKNALEPDGPLFIGAIDPEDASRLLVRHLHAKGSDLLLSRDGGRTFADVLSIKSAMFGFAKAGSTYWAGSGLAEDGVYRSTDRGEHFERVASHGVLCLHAAAGGALFACENALAVGAPVIARSTDRGATFVPLARFADVEGPVRCASDAGRANLCAAPWAELQPLFSPRRDAGAEVPDAGGAAAPPARRSCGCDAVGARTDVEHGVASAFVLLLIGRIRGSRRTQAGQLRGRAIR